MLRPNLVHTTHRIGTVTTQARGGCVQRAQGPVDLNTIHCNPARPHEFVVGGSEEWSSIYDARMLSGGGGGGGGGPIRMPVARFCPAHLVSDGPGTSTHITASAFSRQGELLVQYSRDDIYLFHPWLQGKSGQVRPGC